ncbi:hypothetical protein EC957_008037 [Mortierella hygrophila]|uniref:Uncharacterized protein n=1 Tax=Mortierella hygrophila TaxID=979708 RepID=A0A9P6FCK0_9FUNG|nr:hypothetical protein EC957_008037 [Mortierella hygrophila]
MTYKTTVAFSSGYFIEVIPAGCTLVNQGTVSCSQAGKNMLSLAFQKITAVGDSGGSYLLVEPDAAAVEGVRKDYSTVPVPSSSYKPPATTPQPPPAVVSVQICGEFCTLSTSCSVPTSNTTATPTPTRSLNATATKTSLSTKATASPTHTDLMTTPPAAAPEAEPNTNSNKSAVIIGSIFAVVVVALAVGYALMRRNMTLGAGRGGKKKKKEVDQEEVKYIRPLSPAPPTLPQPPAPVAAPATAAMTMRQLDSASGGGESQSRFQNPSPPVVLGPESRQRQAPPQQPSNTTSTRTVTNTAAAAAASAPMVTRGRSVREAALTRNDRQQPPGTTLAGGSNVEPDMRYLQERQRALAMNANTFASSAPTLFEMSARSLASAPTYTLPQPPPPADPVNISVPVSISTMASLPLPVSTATVNGSTAARAALAETRRSNNSDSSAVDTADLEFLIIPVSNSSASARQRNGTPSSTPPLATRGAEKEEVLEDIDLDDGDYGEREGTLLKKSKSMYPWSSRRGANAGGNGVASSSTTTAGTFTFADTSPLRRAATTIDLPIINTQAV